MSHNDHVYVPRDRPPAQPWVGDPTQGTSSEPSQAAQASAHADAASRAQGAAAHHGAFYAAAPAVAPQVQGVPAGAGFPYPAPSYGAALPYGLQYGAPPQLGLHGAAFQYGVHPQLGLHGAPLLPYGHGASLPYGLQYGAPLTAPIYYSVPLYYPAEPARAASQPQQGAAAGSSPSPAAVNAPQAAANGVSGTTSTTVADGATATAADGTMPATGAASTQPGGLNLNIDRNTLNLLGGGALGALGFLLLTRYSQNAKPALSALLKEAYETKEWLLSKAEGLFADVQDAAAEAKHATDRQRDLQSLLEAIVDDESLQQRLQEILERKRTQADG